MSKHKHHIIPVYHCKELGIDPDFDENYVMVERLDHARIHWGYKCDDLEPLFEYITPAQWIIDLIPRGDSRDAGAAGLIAKGELNMEIRVYKEVSRFIMYHPDDMPLWDEDYVRELEHLRCIKETKRRISDGYDGLKDGEKLQESWEQSEGWVMNEQYRLPNLPYESIEDAYIDSGRFSSLIRINNSCIHHSMWHAAETICGYI